MEDNTTDDTEVEFIEGSDEGVFVGIHAVHRSILVDMLLDGGRDPRFPSLRIGMPCGREYIFERREEVPLKTLKCGCGDPKHIVIKYSMEDEL